MRGERKTSNSMNRDVDDVKIIKFYFKTTGMIHSRQKTFVLLHLM